MQKAALTSSGEAPGQAAGYIYQLRYGLLRALKRLRRDPTASIGVETLDDVVTFAHGLPTAVEQLKHTAGEGKTFSDYSPEFWRATRNWVQLIEKHALDVATIDLVFVTNASIMGDSGIAKLALADEDRDPTDALALLKKVAAASTNEKSEKDRKAFLSLEGTFQAALIRAIRVCGNVPGLASLKSEIEDVIHFVCEPAKLGDFTSELEGWWLERVSSELAHGRGALVALTEVDGRVNYLREKYKAGSLQIDIDSLPPKPDDLDDYVFVKQVRVLKVGELRIQNAQRDFLRASAQRSKWLRESRIDPIELDNYDDDLQHSWSTKAAIVDDEIAETASGADKEKAGRELLGWAEMQQKPLRGASAQFLTSGSFHALADSLLLGWHPDFKKLFGEK